MEQYMGGRLMGGSSSINGEQVSQSVGDGWDLDRTDRMCGLTHTETRPNQRRMYCTCMQVVWPTERLLESIQAEVGGDPDWSPESVYNILRVRDLENGNGVEWAWGCLADGWMDRLIDGSID